MGRHGNMNMNMNKNGGGNVPGNGANAGNAGDNQYMSWSQSLKPLLEKSDFGNYVIASGIRQNGEEEDKTISYFKGKVIKDLGGGDQAKITSGDASTIGKYNKSSIIPLLTGGTDAARNKNISDFKTKLDQVKELYALKIDAETALTAAAYYDYVDNHILNGVTNGNVFAIPIGSTDLHVINYAKKTGEQGLNVEQHNLANYKTEGVPSEISGFVSNNVVDGALVVFAASAFHTLKKMIEENGGNPTEREYGTSVSKLKQMVSDKLEVLNKMNKDGDELKNSGYKIDKIQDLRISINKLFPESMNGINIRIKVSNSTVKGKSFSDKAFNECLKGLQQQQPEAEAQVNGNPENQPPVNGNGNKEAQENIKNQEAEAEAAAVNGTQAEVQVNENGNGTRAVEQPASQGGRRRRTRKVNKNRRKTMKAKKMRRKNKSSKGKKSKTSRRR